MAMLRGENGKTIAREQYQRCFITTNALFPKRFTAFFKLFVSNTLVFAAGNFVHVALLVKFAHAQTSFSLCSQLQWLQLPCKSDTSPGPTKNPRPWTDGKEHSAVSKASVEDVASCYSGFTGGVGRRQMWSLGPSELQIYFNDYCFSLILLIL